MRDLAFRETRAGIRNGRLPAAAPSQGKSLPAPTGGWDTADPLSAMPANNAVVLENWFPQPGWVELRKGFIQHSVIAGGEDIPVDTLMAYQGADSNDDRLFGVADDTIYDCTVDPASATTVTGLNSPRLQYTNFATSGGHFLTWCNGADTPQYYDGAAWTAATISGLPVGTSSADLIQVCAYRGRLWYVINNSTTAAYLPLDSIQGTATTFELGSYFTMGGELVAIGTWSTDTAGGQNEMIVFVSSFGQVAVFLIYDPSSEGGFSYMGTVNLGSPIGRRCLCKAGADLSIITLDGLMTFSQVGAYDRAVLVGKALTNKIQQAMTQATQEFGDQFGWQTISYPRGNMVILNVPLVEGSVQQQYVMNSLNGAWCKFTGQHANCWEIFRNRAYFGGNDGIVRLADEAAADQNSTLEFDMQCAYNYMGIRGTNKRWHTLRALVTKDVTYPVDLQIGLSIDFMVNDALDDTLNDNPDMVAIWDDPLTKWNEAQWPGITTKQNWVAVSGIGYCASIRIKGQIEWITPSLSRWILAHGVWDDGGIWIDEAVWIDDPSEAPDVPTQIDLFVPQVLRINSFDVLFDVGGFI